MEDRQAVRGALGRGLAIELVVEDGFDRAVGAGADLDGAHGGRFDARAAEGAGQPDDAKAGAEALLGMAALRGSARTGRRWSGQSADVFARMRSMVQSA